MTVYKIYCDESRQTGYKYKLMGGIWIKNEYGWPFVDEFHNLCIKKVGILPGHMKWTSVPTKPESQYYQFYTILIDLYYKYNVKEKMFFKTIIADRNYDFKHQLFNQGDSEVGFYKLYYFMILSTLSHENRYHVRLADRTVSKKRSKLSQQDRLCDLQDCLNQGFIKKTEYTYSDNIVLSIESRPAKDRRLIQLADILMGAVGYHWNEMNLLSNAGEGKVFLADYIAQKLGKDNLCFSTSASNRTFNIFRFRPK